MEPYRSSATPAPMVDTRTAGLVVTDWRVSVVICTKDRPEELRRAIASVRAADPIGRTAEIVVVEEAVHARALPDVRYVHLPPHARGFGHTRNVGVGEATGEILAFLDDDCLAEQGWLESLVRPFSRGYRDPGSRGRRPGEGAGGDRPRRKHPRVPRRRVAVPACGRGKGCAHAAPVHVQLRLPARGHSPGRWLPGGSTSGWGGLPACRAGDRPGPLCLYSARGGVPPAPGSAGRDPALVRPPRAERGGPLTGDS